MTDVIKQLEAEKAKYEVEIKQKKDDIFVLNAQVKSLIKAIAALVPKEKE